MILTNGQLVFVIIVIAFLVYAFLNAVLQTITKISTNKVYRIMLEKLVDNISATEAYAIICACKGQDMKNDKGGDKNDTSRKTV